MNHPETPTPTAAPAAYGATPAGGVDAFDAGQRPGETKPATGEMSEANQPIPPRIWAASLADFNNGIHHGAWLPAAQSPEELGEQIQGMLATSPTDPGAEEWLIADTEGFGPIKLGPTEDLQTVCDLAGGIEEFGPVFAAWAAATGGQETSAFRAEYLGEYPDLNTFALAHLAQAGLEVLLDLAIPEPARRYVQLDPEALLRDLQAGGEIWHTPTPDGAVWIFHAN